MRKTATIILLFIALGTIGLLAYKVITKAKQKESAQKNVEVLPEFYFKSNNGTLFTRDSTKGTEVIINYFSPSCEHCQYMAQEFVTHSSLLQSKEIVMVTTANTSEITTFCNSYKLNTLPNIHIVQDTSYSFSKIFGSSMIPCFFIYKENRLQKKIIGESKMENILTE